MYKDFLKRFLDIILSLIAIIILLPVYIIISILVLIFMGWPILFKQPRPGKNEKIFNLYKFRTMTNKKDKDGNLLPDEQRLNKFGRFLRKTSLDELPELFQILFGKMSIVGPRPLLVEYLPYYTEEEHHRHDVRPGLTGWAQVNGRNVTEWNKRLKQDIYYVNNVKFSLDVKIIILTIYKVFKRADVLVGNQYEQGHGRLDIVRNVKKLSSKLLIIGSDFSTIEVVKEAHRRGLYVIVADLMKSSPTKELADEAWLVSTTDIDELEKRCIRVHVDAIMFGASDFNINNARILCKRLKLPIYCDNDKTWEISRNKYLFKSLCKKVGVPVAIDYEVTDNLSNTELDMVIYPVVVKPSDKSGNRGISFCNSKQELIKAYNEARSISSEKIIVERRLVGNEYNIHYVVADGESTLLYLNSTHHEPGYLSNIYSFKSTTNENLRLFLDEVDEKIKKLIKELKCKDGIVWFDAIKDEDGKFYILEMGYRFGGVMTYAPYEKVSGFNVISWMLDIALGVRHKKEDLPMLRFPYKGVAASYHLFSKYECRIKKIEGLDKIEKDNNIYIDMPKRTGAIVRSNACMGLIGIYGDNIENLCKTLKYINNNLKIIDESNNIIPIVYDDYKELKREYYQGIKEF